MLFIKRMSLLLRTSFIATISFIVLGLIGCQTIQSPQLAHPQTIPRLKFLSESHAPFIYPVNGEVRGPVADIVRLACKQEQIECLLTTHDGQIRDGFEAIENGKADAILAVKWNASLSTGFDTIEPLFAEAGQDHLYYLATSKKCDAPLARKFIQALRRVMDHEDAVQIHARYAMRPQVLFPCTLPLRKEPAVLSGDDVMRLQTQSARVVYSAEKFGELSCAYDQRFIPYGAGIVKDSALGILWQNWLHPRLMAQDKIPGLLQDLNQQSFGGCNGWRLPTTEELYSINKFGPVNKPLPPFFSADKDQLSDSIWTVNLGDGKISPASRAEILAFIAVCTDNQWAMTQ